MTTISKKMEIERPAKDISAVIKELRGAKNLEADMEYVNRRAPTYTQCMLPQNVPKNRFQNLIVWDHSRVKLNDRFFKKNPEVGDYINASAVDGFERPNEYILCMGPTKVEHEELFWRMVLDQRCTVGVLLTNLAQKKDQQPLVSNFWPMSHKEKRYCSNRLLIKTNEMISGPDYDTYIVNISVTGDPSQKHQIQLLHYRKWMDDMDPTPAILPFVSRVRLIHKQMEMKLNKEQFNRPPSSILLICPTGVHRAGSFAVLDISLQRIHDQHRVAMQETVREIRRQRFGCVAKTKQYLALVEILVSHCIQSGLIEAEDLIDDDGRTPKKATVNLLGTTATPSTKPLPSPHNKSGTGSKKLNKKASNSKQASQTSKTGSKSKTNSTTTNSKLKTNSKTKKIP